MHYPHDSLLSDLSKAAEAPKPYWCLIFKGDDYERFREKCDYVRNNGGPYPQDYQQMWDANKLLKSAVTSTFLTEADRLRSTCNGFLHNKKAFSKKDPVREAEICIDTYEYILEEVMKIINKDSGALPSTSKVDLPAGNSELSEGANGFGDLWFKGLQKKLESERSRTQYR